MITLIADDEVMYLSALSFVVYAVSLLHPFHNQLQVELWPPSFPLQGVLWTLTQITSPVTLCFVHSKDVGLDI